MHRFLIPSLLLLAGTFAGSVRGDEKKKLPVAGPTVGKKMPLLPKVESVTNLHTDKREGRICYSCFKRSA